MNIFETSGPVEIKFILRHNWDEGKASVGLGPDRIGTLVSIATDNTHRVIMGKIL